MNRLFMNIDQKKRTLLAMIFLFFSSLKMEACNIFYFTPDEMGYWANVSAYIEWTGQAKKSFVL